MKKIILFLALASVVTPTVSHARSHRRKSYRSHYRSVKRYYKNHNKNGHSSKSFTPLALGTKGTYEGISPESPMVTPESPFTPIPNTGGEPMIAVLAGLSIAGIATTLRKKVSK